jgi:glycosyltransferase involved in cell wall biosynthesis
MYLDIIIPAFNEENFIEAVLCKLVNLDFEGMLDCYAITVVDDCSTDRTVEIVRRFMQNMDQIQLICHDKNMGKGAAVRTGIKSTRGEFILIQDADLELCPDDIVEMVRQMLLLKVDFINGSRYLPGVIRPLYSYRRYYINKLFTKLASVLINIRLTDIACGYKLFSRKIVNQIKLQENKFGFEAELLIKTVKLRRTLVAEVPVQYFPRNAGEGKKIRNIDGLRILYTILKYSLFQSRS